MHDLNMVALEIRKVLLNKLLRKNNDLKLYLRLEFVHGN